jgi:ATP:corrinoid adenosyltransferase
MVPSMRHAISNAALDEGDIAIIGQKGKGKTFAAKGFVERLISRGRLMSLGFE